MAEIVRLEELVQSAHPRVDRAAGVIRDVKVIGLASSNGRRYPAETLAAAMPLYEGARVNVDHAQGAAAGDRRLAERFGVLKNVTRRDDGLYGELHYLRSHPLAELTAEAAERMPEALGLSHNAEGRVRRENDHWIVEQIVRVHSVDVVSDPATCKGLFEAAAAGDGSRPSSPGAAERLAEALAADGLLARDDAGRARSPQASTPTLAGLARRCLEQALAEIDDAPEQGLERVARLLRCWREAADDQPDLEELLRENRELRRRLETSRGASSAAPRSADRWQTPLEAAWPTAVDGRRFAAAIR